MLFSGKQIWLQAVQNLWSTSKPVKRRTGKRFVNQRWQQGSPPVTLEALEDRCLLAATLSVDPISAAVEGTPSSLTGSVSGLEGNNNFTLDIDWGDGQTEQYLATTDGSGAHTFAIPHAYPDEGVYSIDVSLTEAPLLIGADAVFVIDVSGSTNQQFSGTAVGDLNGDGQTNTILDAEIAAFVALNQNLIDRGLGNVSQVSVVSFSTGALQIDMNPAQSGLQLATTPLADENNNGIRDVDEALRSLQWGGATHYRTALQRAIDTLAAVGSPAGESNVIFISDGQPYPSSQGQFATEVNQIKNVLGQNLRAFGAGTNAPLTALQQMDPSALQFTSTDQLLDVFSGTGPAGGGTALASSSASVANAIPAVVSLSFPASVLEGSGFTLSGSFTDAGISDNHTVSIDWGDGVSSPAAVTQGSGGGSFTANHTYADDGDGDGSGTSADDFSVNVTITDNAGAAVDTIANITVENVAPDFDAGTTAVLIPADAGVFNRPLTFSDPGADVWTGTVDFGDGTGTLPITVNQSMKTFELNHTYSSEGLFLVAVTLEDDDAGIASDTFSVSVLLNTPPVADPGGPYTLDEGAPVTLDGTASSDVETPNAFMAFEWDLDYDGSSFDVDVTGEEPLAVFPDGDDSRVIALRVTDEGGKSQVSTTTVIVENVQPTLGLSATPIPLDEGSPLALTVQSVNDPGDDTIVNYRFIWGDGTSDTVVSAATLASQGNQVTHIYDDGPISPQIQVNVTDEDGTFAAGFLTVAAGLQPGVRNVSPTAQMTNSGPVSEGSSAVVSFGGQFDPSTADMASLRYSYDLDNNGLFDDGAGDGTYAGSLSTASQSVPALFFTDDGSHTVAGRVLDDDGGFNDYSTTISIENAAPQLTSLSVPAVVDEGESFTVSGAFSDFGLDDTHTVLVDWGDGNETPATVTAGTGNGTFTATHVYADDGPSPGNGTPADNSVITVTVTDDDAGSDSSAESITVRNVAPVLENRNVTPAINENESAILSFDIIDPGVADVFTMVVDWGDGEPAETIVIPAGTTTFSANHQYLDDNPSGTPFDVYDVRILSFEDDDGGSAGLSLGGSIFLTGHDIVSQSHRNQNGYSVVVLDYLRGAGTLDEISRSDYDIGLVNVNVNGLVSGQSVSNGQPGVFIQPGLQWDPRDGVTFGAYSTLEVNNSTMSTDFAAFLSGLDVLVIPEHGLEDNIAAFNSFAPEIEAFFNNGGDLFVDSSNALANYYDFLPSVLGADGPGISSSGNFQVTSAGAAIGVTPPMLRHATHNTFLNPDPLFTIFETYIPNGNPVSIGAQDVVINNGTLGSALQVVVSNVAPVFDAGPDETLLPAVTGAFSRTITFTDQGTQDTHSVSIDYGDGSPVTSFSQTAGDYDFDLNNTYVADGVYEVIVTVTDDDTGTLEDRFEVEVILNTPPTADAGGPYTVPEGGTVTLDGSDSADDQQPTASLIFEWDLDGDNIYGETGSAAGRGDETGISPTFTAAGLDGPGSLTVSLKVTDNFGETDFSSATIDITNVAPEITSFNAPVIDEDGTATVSGSFSDVGTPDTHTVTIDWGDGSSSSATVDPVLRTFTADHQYLDDDPTVTPSDVYTIGIAIEDDDGGTDTGVTSVRVNNVAPEITSFNAPVIDEDGTATVSGSFSDVGTLDTHTVTIDWGDGSSSSATVDAVLRTFTADHQYLDDDPTVTPSDMYTIGIAIADDDGGTDTGATSVTVNNVAPEITSFNAPVIDEDGTATVSGSFSDVGTLDTHTVTIDWGDGSSSSATVDPVLRTFTADHQYLDDDPTVTPSDVYTIGIAIADDDGGTDTGVTSVRVNNVAPEITSFNAPVIDEDGTATVSGSFSDVGTLDSHTVTIDWGDGSSSSATVDPVLRTFTADHQYLDDDPTVTPSDVYTIGIAIADDDGGTDTGVTSVRVNNVAPEITSFNAPVIDEDGTATVSGSFSDVGTLDTHTVTIDWGDGTSSSATVDPVLRTFTADHQYLDDDPTVTPSDVYTIGIAIADDDGGTDTGVTSVTVKNVAPISLTIGTDASAPCDASDDHIVELAGSFSDVGTLDTHTVVVDWGDGSALESIAVDQLENTYGGSHDYSTGGIFQVIVTITDDDGGVVTDETQSVVQGVGVVDGTLYIIGTDGRDHVKLKVNQKKDELKVDVKLNQGGSDGGSDGGKDKGNKKGRSDGGSDGSSDGGSDGGGDRYKLTLAASQIDRVVAFLCDGDDHYDGGSDGGSDGNSDGGADINIRQLVFGGDGDDHLSGGRWNDAVFGGAGRDKIFGANGNDLLVGGDGRDNIKGGRGDDLLVGGIVDNDFDDVSIIDDIDNALAEWATGSLADTLNSLGAIIDDDDKDKLFGEKGDDELLGGVGDKLKH